MRPSGWPSTMRRADRHRVGRHLAVLAILALALVAAGGGATPVRAEEPVVRAVLFYSPACGHCHKVMTVDLPPLMARHGDVLQVAAVDVTPDAGQALYVAAVERFGLQDRRGVPTLIVGDVALVGSVEIPERFPGLVDEYLAAGGVDWPDIPGLVAALATPPPTAEPSADAPVVTASPSDAAPVAPEPATPSPSGAAVVPLDPATSPPPADDGLAARLDRDPAGSAIAIGVLGLMLAVLLWAGATIVRAGRRAIARPPSPWIAALGLVGIGVAAYLAYVETAAVEAVCGPVGDCNAVQQSEYARLFGVLPIGVLGLAGYVAILGAWALARRPGSLAGRARITLLALALGGTVFSAWLTFLEPFVIGAVCAWCVTSAVVMTALLVIAVRSMGDPRPAAAGRPAAPAPS